eukprot:ANDGO_05890.mRNA.1 DNA ligase 4
MQFPFSHLASILEDVSNAGMHVKKNVAERRKNILTERLWKQVAKGDFYPFLRLMVPALDEDRSRFHMKEASLANSYIEIMQIEKTSPDAQRLLHFKDPGMSKSRTAIDFSDALYRVLMDKGYGSVDPSQKPISVAWVNARLTELSMASSQDGKKKILMQFFFNTRALEQKWIVRIILQDLRVGMQKESILASFHPFAEALHNQCVSLKRVCLECRNPDFRIEEGAVNSIQLGTPFKPMLAFAIQSLHELDRALRDGRYVVESKFDGDRIQIHVTPESITYFSRNSTNYTPVYGPTFDSVVRASLREQGMTYNCILDGEMLVWNSELGGFLEFGHNRSVSILHRTDLAKTHKELVEKGLESAHLQFCFMCFDVVYLFKDQQDRKVANAPLRQRRDILKKIVQSPVSHRLEIVQQTEVPEHADAARVLILSELDRAVTEDRAEGLILKNLDTPYSFNKRELKSWSKLKPDLLWGAGQTLDLVVIGGFYGTKYGKAHISHFLMGLRNAVCTTSEEFVEYIQPRNRQASSSDALQSHPPTLSVASASSVLSNFKAAMSLDLSSSSSRVPMSRGIGSLNNSLTIVCSKVGSGYTDEELMSIQNKLEPHWRPWNSDVDANIRACVFGSWRSGDHANVPAVWCDPRNSVVLEVKFFDIVESKMFQTGYALRFPRAIRVREDKDFWSCTSAAEFTSIRQARVARQSLGLSQDLTATARRFGRGRGAARPSWNSTGSIPAHLKSIDSRIVQKEDELFDSISFCVLHPTNAEERRRLEEVIIRHSGTITQDYHSASFVLSTSADEYRTHALIQAYNAALTEPAKKKSKSASARPSSMPRDILTVKFVSDCIEEGRIIDPPHPIHHVIYSIAETRQKIAVKFDPFGDAYEEDISAPDLLDLLENHYPTSRDKIAADGLERARKTRELEQQQHVRKRTRSSASMLSADSASLSLQDFLPAVPADPEVERIMRAIDTVTLSPFAECKLVFLSSEAEEVAVRIAVKVAQISCAQGVTVWRPAIESLEAVPSDATHLVVCPADELSTWMAHRIRYLRSENCHVVSDEWIYACIDTMRRVSERDFAVPIRRISM